MARYILRRFVAGVLLLATTCTITFWLLRIAGGDIGRSVLGAKATNEQVRELNTKFGLDKRLVVQYLDWAGGIVRGRFGNTWASGNELSVWSSINQRVPVTITIVLLSVLFASSVAVVFGVFAAVRGRGMDNAVQVGSIFAFSIPSFLLAFGLISIFSIRYRLFHAIGYTHPTESIWEWLRSATLPVISLSLGTLASVTLQIRSAIKDGMNLDYTRTLRSRGLSARRTVFKHALRNAAGPALAVVNTQFIGLLGGAVIIERIFNLPGLGPAVLEASVRGDMPVVMAAVVITGVLVVLMNLLVDLLTAWLNPKVRLA